jgi:hypothetical protein
MTTELSLLYCPECGRDCLAEAPPCTDGHCDASADGSAAECPDRACVECGTALLLDAPLFHLADRRSARRPGRRSGRRSAA